MSPTDLGSVSLRGRGGSINEPGAACERCPYVLLDHALAAVPAPPLDDTTRRAAYRWLADVERGLVSRRERRTLANAILRALADEFHSRRTPRTILARSWRYALSHDVPRRRRSRDVVLQ